MLDVGTNREIITGVNTDAGLVTLDMAMATLMHVGSQGLFWSYPSLAQNKKFNGPLIFRSTTISNTSVRLANYKPGDVFFSGQYVSKNNQVYLAPSGNTLNRDGFIPSNAVARGVYRGRGGHLELADRVQNQTGIPISEGQTSSYYGV